MMAAQLIKIDRDNNARDGRDYLINRREYILHMQGIAYTGKVRENVEALTKEKLKNTRKWNTVYEHKQIRVVALKHKIG